MKFDIRIEHLDGKILQFTGVRVNVYPNIRVLMVMRDDNENHFFPLDSLRTWSSTESKRIVQ